jgi:hypothetical protein
MRVNGRLVEIDAPIAVRDLSRTGFAILSAMPFQTGATLDFRLVGPDASEASVTAEAVHSQPVPDAARLHLTGFKFVPGRLTGVLPQPSIDRLIAAVTVPSSASMIETVPPPVAVTPRRAATASDRSPR